MYTHYIYIYIYVYVIYIYIYICTRVNPCIYMHGASSHEVCCFEMLWNVAPYLYPVHLSLSIVPPCTEPPYFERHDQGIE